jgi:uncharacterized protein with FMN-binding domain
MRKNIVSYFFVASFIAYAFFDKSGNASVDSLSDQQPVAITEKYEAVVPASKYKDGAYVGPVRDAYYGNVQVKALVSGGKLVDIEFLAYPNDRSTSLEINSQAMPILKSEAIRAQDSDVNMVSGATATSEAFIQSLTAALSSAQI